LRFAFGLAFGPPATTAKARRIAANVAKLPELLRNIPSSDADVVIPISTTVTYYVTRADSGELFVEIITYRDIPR